MNKTSGGDGNPVEFFQFLKDNAVKMLHSISQFSFQSQRKAMQRMFQLLPNCTHIWYNAGNKSMSTEKYFQGDYVKINRL